MKCDILRILARRRGYGTPMPRDRLLDKVPVDRQRMGDAEDALDELCADEPFVSERNGRVSLDGQAASDLRRFARACGPTTRAVVDAFLP